jgi:hypothetical protein
MKFLFMAALAVIVGGCAVAPPLQAQAGECHPPRCTQMVCPEERPPCPPRIVHHRHWHHRAATEVHIHHKKVIEKTVVDVYHRKVIREHCCEVSVVRVPCCLAPPPCNPCGEPQSYADPPGDPPARTAYTNNGLSPLCAGRKWGEHFTLPDGRDAYCEPHKP